MLEISQLPTLNAALNATSMTLLLVGYALVRMKKVTAHRWFMLAAFGVSVAFLVSYVCYHLLAEPRRFGGQGGIRVFYFVLLVTHVVLAATVPFLAARTLYLGLRGRVEQHRRIARWTFPIWLYVSVTGVLVYLFLYKLYAPLGPG